MRPCVVANSAAGASRSKFQFVSSNSRFARRFVSLQKSFAFVNGDEENGFPEVRMRQSTRSDQMAA